MFLYISQENPHSKLELDHRHTDSKESLGEAAAMPAVGNQSHLQLRPSCPKATVSKGNLNLPVLTCHRLTCFLIGHPEHGTQRLWYMLQVVHRTALAAGHGAAPWLATCWG